MDLEKEAETGSSWSDRHWHKKLVSIFQNGSDRIQFMVLKKSSCVFAGQRGKAGGGGGREGKMRGS